MYFCQEKKSIDIQILRCLLYLQMVIQYAEPVDLPEVQVIQGNIHLRSKTWMEREAKPASLVKFC